jgi:4-oxalocrotonate tautomerase
MNMPLLSLQVTRKADLTLSKQIAQTLTQLTAKFLQKEPSLTAVNINFIEPTHWYVDSKSMTQNNSNSFSLRICITDGTNSTDQVQEYINAVYSAMQDLIGSIKCESYIVVDHIPATHWGYGGKTQQFRKHTTI